MRTLVIGYGNPVRGDDAAGIIVAGEIEKTGLANIAVKITHQLQLETTEELAGFDRIIFVDAQNNGPDVSFAKVSTAEPSGMSSSHHMGPALLGRLAKKLYHHAPEIFLCSIRGDSFNFETDLSPACSLRVKTAVKTIQDFLQKEASRA